MTENIALLATTCSVAHRREPFFALVSTTDRTRIHQSRCGKPSRIFWGGGCTTNRLQGVPMTGLVKWVCGGSLMSPNRNGQGAYSPPLLLRCHRHRHKCTSHKRGASNYICLAFHRKTYPKSLASVKQFGRECEISEGGLNPVSMLDPIFQETLLFILRTKQRMIFAPKSRRSGI